MSLRVDRIFGLAMLQGEPRLGRRNVGVPPGGAFDQQALQALNRCLGNPAGALVLELALCRLELTALSPLRIAWHGPAEVSVDGAVVSAETGVTRLLPGSSIHFGVPPVAVREWVAVAGGLCGHPGFVPRTGDLLEVGAPGQPDEAALERPLAVAGGPIHAFAGRREFVQLFKNVYTVRHDSDRVGIRLDGPRMAHRLELPSEPATPGVVQITPEGLPIILGPDGPTIGGYPRAAVVATAELRRLAQLRPGDIARFKRIAPGARPAQAL